jgi:hypothetical protein
LHPTKSHAGAQFELGIPTSEEPELLDLNYDQWQCDADLLLTPLGHESYDFGSLTGNSFKPMEEESHVMGTSSLHKKKVLKVHKQFMQMLHGHKATEAFANYDGTYRFQFYRIFQGMKTTAKQNAMNNIMALWLELFNHRLDCKPYQPSCIMLVLHSLFGELSCRGV